VNRSTRRAQERHLWIWKRTKSDTPRTVAAFGRFRTVLGDDDWFTVHCDPRADGLWVSILRHQGEEIAYSESDHELGDGELLTWAEDEILRQGLRLVGMGR
jgi:hypothetical protein